MRGMISSRWMVAALLMAVVLVGCGREPEPGAGTAAPGATAPAAGSGLHPTAEWLLACRVGTGGFGWYPGDSAFTSCTGMALEALAELDELDQLEGQAELVAWLRAHRGEDGGYFEARDFYGPDKPLKWGSLGSLEASWWALRALQLLGAEPEDPAGTARFIAARQDSSGAFSSAEFTGDDRPAAYTTGWAVAALKTLGLPVPDSAKVVAWLRSQQETIFLRGGFALEPVSFNFATPQGTLYAVEALARLGAAPARPEDVKQFLLSEFGQEPDGGFEMGHGPGWNNYDHYSRMMDTYAAVTALDRLDLHLSDSDSSRAARPAADCIAWITAQQQPDGGFSPLGVSDQTPLVTPADMRSTWQAVHALRLLGSPVPLPQRPIPARNEVEAHALQYRHEAIDGDDPADIWRYRRIALPIYRRYLEQTGSPTAAVGMLSRWVRAYIGPENYGGPDRGLRARKNLMHSWGQCGTMSLILQALAVSVDHPARGAFVWGDAQTEVRLREPGWDREHWVCYVPFTNEYLDPGLATPEGAANGWSAADIVIESQRRARFLNYSSLTHLGDHRYWRVYIQTYDYATGLQAEDYRVDTSMTYQSEAVRGAYPDSTW